MLKFFVKNALLLLMGFTLSASAICVHDQIALALARTSTPSNDNSTADPKLTGMLMRVLDRRRDRWLSAAERLTRVVRSPQMLHPNSYGRLLIESLFESMLSESLSLPARNRHSPNAAETASLRALSVAMVQSMLVIWTPERLLQSLERTIGAHQQKSELHLFTTSKIRQLLSTPAKNESLQLLTVDLDATTDALEAYDQLAKAKEARALTFSGKASERVLVEQRFEAVSTADFGTVLELVPLPSRNRGLLIFRSPSREHLHVETLWYAVEHSPALRIEIVRITGESVPDETDPGTYHSLTGRRMPPRLAEIRNGENAARRQTSIALVFCGAVVLAEIVMPRILQPTPRMEIMNGMYSSLVEITGPRGRESQLTANTSTSYPAQARFRTDS